MRSPLSRPSYNFSPFYHTVRTASADLRRAFFSSVPSLWSPESCLQNAPPRSGTTRPTSPLRTHCSLLCETTLRHASGLAASRVGAARAWPWPGRRCRRQTSIRVGTRVSTGVEQAEAPQAVFAHWRSAEAWYRDDPSVPRWPHGLPVYVTIARTSPRRDVAVVSPVSLACPPGAVCSACSPGEAESALQACNRRGIPRPTAHQRCPAPGATVSGAVLAPRRRRASAPPCRSAPHQAAGFFALGLVILQRQSTTLAPAGISPRSK